MGDGRSELPTVFVWEVTTPDGADTRRGPSGASREETRALAALSHTLRRSPLGAHGEVREVALSMRDGQYIRLGVVARMRVDAEHGVMVWTDS
jgi:hypothetical protein